MGCHRNYHFPALGFQVFLSLPEYGDGLLCLCKKRSIEVKRQLLSHRLFSISPNSTIMDKYNQQKEVALVVDEWGIVSDAEPAMNVCASRDSLGAVHISLVNLDPSGVIIVQTPWINCPHTRSRDRY